MAKSDGSVRIDTLVNTKGFDKGMNTMQKQIGGLSSAIGKLGVAITATFAVRKLIQFGKEAIDLGSDLQEVQNVVDVTFTTMSDKVNEFAKGAAEAAGLSETMAKRYVGTFGAMAKAFGFAENESYDMATALTQLAGDVASFYNLTQDEAYTKLKSVFTGETESLKDLGVVMTQSALDSFAMAKGWGKTTAAMSENEKVALRFAFVTEQLNAASGDFIRTQDSWANQTRILSLNFDSFKANIGQALINIFTPFLKVVNQIVAKMAELSQHFVAFSELLVGKSTSGGGGSPGEALAEIESGYTDIADATDEATKAQKKYLSGLDEIRTFTEENKNGASVNVYGGSSVNISDVKSYEEKINEAYADIEENTLGFVKRIKNIFSNFKSDMSKVFTGDWNTISDNLAEYILGGLSNFKNSELYSLLQDLGIKETFNNFFEDLWAEITEPDFSTMQNTLGESFADWILENVFQISPEADGEKIRAEVVSQVKDYLSKLWKEASNPDFFTSQNQAGINFSERIKTDLLGWTKDESIISKFQDWWNGEFVNWWNANVAKWFKNTFSKERLINLMSGVKEAFSSIWKGSVNIAIVAINTLIDSMNELASIEWSPLKAFGKEIIPGGSAKLFEIPKIPYLASGAVIPPNAPFMAMLGDQRHGTNIEAPLDTIKQAVREVIGSGGGGRYAFTAQINRRTLFEEVIDEAKLRQSTSGRNPFDLA